jgi:hypothetical protein
VATLLYRLFAGGLGGRAGVPGACAKLTVSDGACGARAKGLSAGAGLLDLILRKLSFDRGCACASVLIALTGGHQEPEQGFRWGRVHAAALLIEDTKIVLTVRDTEFGSLPEPAERRCFIERCAFAAREVNAEIVHGAAIAGCSSALGPLTRDREIGCDAFAALVELGQTILRHSEAAIGGAAEHGDALSRTAGGDALKRELVLRREIAALRCLLKRDVARG